MKYFTIFWLLVFSNVCTNCQCNGNPKRVLCIEDEREALFQLKHDLIDGANRLSSWSSQNVDCCNWSGIVCDNFTGHVQELRLRGPDPELEEASTQMLGGNINPSLLVLKQLKYLDLSSNNFYDIQIPSFIGSLRNLRYLNLSRSQFYGRVPHQLGNLSMLVVLDLWNGPYLTDIAVKSLNWLSSLHSLQYLDMTGYDLSGASDWVQVTNILPSLVELHLSSCNLSQIPHLAKVNFTSLTSLDLSYNLFNSLIPGWIFSLRKLVSLDLTRCLFYGPDRGSVGNFHNMTDLNVLRVSENNFMSSPSVLRGVLSLTNLVSLDINTCNISTPVLGGILNMTSLASVDLSQNNILETIPNSFGKLCNLSFVDLRENRFSGNVTEILNNFCECKSSKLKHLAFSANRRLVGHIPDRTGQLENLVIFDLAFNNISGTILESLGRLSSLKYLMLNVNLFSGPIPYTIGNLKSLEWLEIAVNNFSGNLPKSMGQLGKLEFLSVHRNSLTGVVTEDHFANLTALRTLRAEGNMLTLKLDVDNWVPPFQIGIFRIGSWNIGPRFPLWLQSQKDLKDLDLSSSRISDIIPTWFCSSFSDIGFLNMSHNDIQGPLLGDLSFLGPDAVVDLSDNHFEGPMPVNFNEANFLLLDLSNNRLSGSLEQFLCPNSEKARQLRVLDLANNNLSGVIPDCWVNWQALSVISFENNGLSGEIPQFVGNLSSLQSFNIRNNKLSGKVPASLLNSKSLQIIDIAENELTGSIPSLIVGEESKLKLLNLRSNKLEGEIPIELCRLTSIQMLDLAHNNLSGTIPTCFNNFSSKSERQNMSAIVLYDEPFQVQVLGSASLVSKGKQLKYSSILYLVTTLDLSGNKLSGSIPNELMGLLGLRWLNLSGNHLTGRIPKEIGKMTLLESLDLSVNKLDGMIPRSISSLTYLSSLNVSYNKLSGEIPMSTQLQSLNESSFMGNTLCGPPLAKLCIKKGVVSPEVERNDDESDGPNWGFTISIVLGFIINFWVVMAPLIASRVWRNAYFFFLYKVWLKIRIFYHNSFL